MQLTEGPIARQLIAFALTLFPGILIQQLCNTAAGFTALMSLAFLALGQLLVTPALPGHTRSPGSARHCACSFMTIPTVGCRERSEASWGDTHLGA